METLNESDIETLTKIENKLLRMRRREVANTNSQLVNNSLIDAIKAIDETRDWLGSRLDVPVDTLA